MAHCKSKVAPHIGVRTAVKAAPVSREGAPAADDLALLLPWHAAGALNDRDNRRVNAALADDPRLARQYAAVRQEYVEIVACDDDLGAPSSRAMRQLFAAIDAEEGRPATATDGSSIVSLRPSARVQTSVLALPRACERQMMVKKIVRCV